MFQRGNRFTMIVPVLLSGRLYSMEFVRVGKGFSDSVTCLRDKLYPFWGMYGFWAWLQSPPMKNPPYSGTIWWGLN
jgi:hypothetical protein